VSRKISLDTLVDFAVAQGSQWIFITPHDIRSINTISISVVLGFILFYNSSYLSFSMVKAGDSIKKQQMAAPRG
jgi:structural maintenance of chromosomes protein 6